MGSIDDLPIRRNFIDEVFDSPAVIGRLQITVKPRKVRPVRVIFSQGGIHSAKHGRHLVSGSAQHDPTGCVRELPGTVEHSLFQKGLQRLP